MRRAALVPPTVPQPHAGSCRLLNLAGSAKVALGSTNARGEFQHQARKRGPVRRFRFLVGAASVVVAVHLGEEWLILDNLTLIMVNSSDARHYRPLFVLDHRGVGVVGFGGVGDDLQTRPADFDLSQPTASSGGVYQKP